jgi:CRP/FNR family transcriptional regulator, cyclic AMP receptor protein
MLAIRRPDPYLESLGQLVVFKGCTRAELIALSRHTTPLPIRAGTVLCREGAPGRQAFIIVDGQAAVTLGGKEIARLGPGDPCGEMALLEQAPRTATVTALTPMEALVLSPSDFLSLLTDAPTVTRRLLVSLSHRLRRADQAGVAE